MYEPGELITVTDEAQWVYVYDWSKRGTGPHPGTNLKAGTPILYLGCVFEFEGLHRFLVGEKIHYLSWADGGKEFLESKSRRLNSEDD